VGVQGTLAAQEPAGLTLSQEIKVAFESPQNRSCSPHRLQVLGIEELARAAVASADAILIDGHQCHKGASSRMHPSRRATRS
jgi:hypothetical protein